MCLELLYLDSFLVLRYVSGCVLFGMMMMMMMADLVTPPAQCAPGVKVRCSKNGIYMDIVIKKKKIGLHSSS